MAKERVWMTRNTGTAESPQWEKYFPKTGKVKRSWIW